MAKRKLQRFAEILTFKNVFQHIQEEAHVKDFHLKGKWGIEYFKNDHPIILELGCGKGEYTIGLASQFSSQNFIGIDLKGNRIWRGAKTALENKIENVGFLRMRIENIATAFSRDEISEIWITFPDPQPQSSREKKRLTSPQFLKRYESFLKKDAIIHLKTDNKPLYQYTLDVVRDNKYQLLEYSDDLYHKQPLSFKENAPLAIKTFYEKKFSDLGYKICYLKFKVNS